MASPDIPGVPEQYQWLIYLIGGVGAVWSAIRALGRGQREGERASNPDVIVQGGSFVDMRPVKEMNEHLAHLVNHMAAQAIATRNAADALEDIRKIMKDGADVEKTEEIMRVAMLRLQLKEQATK